MIATKFGKYIEYTREHWHEWFWVFVLEGEMMPRFFLPTERCFDRHGYIAWIVPLAPFVLLFRALYAGFWTTWRDSVVMIDKWQEVYRNKQ